MFFSLMRKWFHLNLPHKSLPESPNKQSGFKAPVHSYCVCMIQHHSEFPCLKCTLMHNKDVIKLLVL